MRYRTMGLLAFRAIATKRLTSSAVRDHGGLLARSTLVMDIDDRTKIGWQAVLLMCQGVGAVRPVS